MVNIDVDVQDALLVSQELENGKDNVWNNYWSAAAYTSDPGACAVTYRLRNRTRWPRSSWRDEVHQPN